MQYNLVLSGGGHVLNVPFAVWGKVVATLA